MRRSLCVVALLTALTAPVLAAPLSDLAGSAEARDAVATLAAKGLLRGYPGGVYKGDRAMSRNEVAELLHRLDRYLDSLLTGTATKEDLRSLETSLKALLQNLEDLGGRVDRSDQQIQRLDRRTR